MLSRFYSQYEIRSICECLFTLQLRNMIPMVRLAGSIPLHYLLHSAGSEQSEALPSSKQQELPVQVCLTGFNEWSINCMAVRCLPTGGERQQRNF